VLEQDSRAHSDSSFDISISLRIDHNRKRSKKHRTWITNGQPKQKPKKQTTSRHHQLQCDKQDLGSIHSELDLAGSRSESTFAVVHRIYGERGLAVPHEICSKHTSDPLPLRLRTVHVQRREKSLTLLISTQLCLRAQIPRFLCLFLQNRQPTAQHKTMRSSKRERTQGFYVSFSGRDDKLQTGTKQCKAEKDLSISLSTKETTHRDRGKEVKEIGIAATWLRRVSAPMASPKAMMKKTKEMPRTRPDTAPFPPFPIASFYQ